MGHYTGWVKAANDHWYKTDDSYITPDDVPFDFPGSYILLYRKAPGLVPEASSIPATLDQSFPTQLAPKRRTRTFTQRSEPDESSDDPEDWEGSYQQLDPSSPSVRFVRLFAFISR